MFQCENIYRPEDRSYERKYRHRIGYLNPRHATVAPFAHHLRLVLLNDDNILDRFGRSCKDAGLRPPVTNVEIESSRQRFFTPGNLHSIHEWLRTLTWRVAFQVAALLHNGIANTEEIRRLKPRIESLICRHQEIAGEVLRYFTEAAKHKALRQPLEICFETALQKRFRRRRLAAGGGRFFCHHVTFTPTRLLLEGPNIAQSNRVIREYAGYEDFFLRVDFRDEDRLQYRWDRDVDGTTYLQERVGTLLKKGFDLAGRHFEFLAYSQSALRSHAVWYVCPFEHDRLGWVTAETIRAGLGDFTGVIYSPSKYGARMAVSQGQHIRCCH